MKRTASLAIAMLLAGSAFAAEPFGAGELMHRLAAHPASRVDFVERKYLASLDRPLESSGELAFTAPSRLEKRTIRPKPETLVIDGDTLSIERDGTRRSLSLTSYPEASAFIGGIRATLSGDLATLARSYRVVVDGSAARWKLTLLPSDPKIAAVVSRVTIDGHDDRIAAFEVLQADGNRSVTTISPHVDPPPSGGRP